MCEFLKLSIELVGGNPDRIILIIIKVTTNLRLYANVNFCPLQVQLQ